MAEAKKLPSGKWRCRAFLGRDENGNQIRKSFTADTKKEAERLAKECEVKEKSSLKRISDKDITVRIAVERYVRKKEEDCEKGREKASPSTIRGYRKILNNNIDYIAEIPCLKLDDDVLNEWIDTLRDKGLKARTIKNAWYLVRASLKSVLPLSRVIDFDVDLPTMSKTKVVVPTEEDIKKLVDYLKKTDRRFYIAVMLAAFGTLRRSEICALTAEDVDRVNNIIRVNKALVEDYRGGYTVKPTKTEDSTREVLFPAFVIKELPEEGQVVDVLPQWISENFNHLLKELDIPHFRFHDLRHYSASIMHYLGAPNETIMHRGGWASDHALNEHYRGSMSEYDKAFTEKLNKHFEEKFNS